RKYSTLRKQKKALLAFKKQSSGAQSSKGGIKRSLYDQPLTDTATTTVEAKMLENTGAISAITAENKNSGFKRSHTLEGKLKVRECTW
ncbi:negative elongation factor E-like, partial [Amblyraja radiata]|uniref:negative elongation factor E-like n=1 Tax=Amblyraja radiata TaxID=386614 RepID=UPI0014020FE7